MTYTTEQISQIQSSSVEWIERSHRLQMCYTLRTYNTTSGREYGLHGFARRLQLLRYAFEKMFDSLPLNEEQPSLTSLYDATLLHHAFLINCYGSIDNLARVWLYENMKSRDEGSAIPDGHVGFGPSNTTVRNSLPDHLLTHVESMDEWFKYLSNYRHALAHRIPPYIVPKVYTPSDRDQHLEVEQKLNEALSNFDIDEWNSLRNEREQIGKFESIIMHSFEESSVPVRIHPQMGSDFATIIEFGEKIMDGLVN